MASRAETIISLFDTTGKGLEIGPSHAPLAPKSSGFDVEIYDYLTASDLRKKYASAGVDVSRVEEVDYVGDGRSMLDVIGDKERFRWILASHVIEHVADLIGFLQDCASLLKHNGCLVLAVPDKRCCFDILRPVSTVGQVLQAHLEQRTRPQPGSIFDDVVYAHLRRNASGWPLAAEQPLTANKTILDGWRIFEEVKSSHEYHDVHCWVFVPSSFRVIVDVLSSMSEIDMSIEKMHVVDGEFYVVMKKGVCKIGIPDLGSLVIDAAMEEREAKLRADG